MLRRQQFQQQQQLQQQQQNQVDMKKNMSSLDETDINNIRVPILPPHHHHHQVMMKQQDMATIISPNYYTAHDQEQQGYFCTIFNGYAAVPEATSSNEDFLWDGLWNLDDDIVHGNFSAVSAATRATLQSLATPCFF